MLFKMALSDNEQFKSSPKIFDKGKVATTFLMLKPQQNNI